MEIKNKMFIPHKKCLNSRDCFKILTDNCNFKHDQEQIDFAMKERSTKKHKIICKNRENCDPSTCDFLHTMGHYEHLKRDSSSPNCNKGWECVLLLEGKCRKKHDDEVESFAETERSRKAKHVVCKFGSKCNLNGCEYLHLKGDYDGGNSLSGICKNGWECRFILEDVCKYNHSKSQKEYAEKERNIKKFKIICKNSPNCKPQDCKYLHFKKDYDLDREIPIPKGPENCKKGWDCIYLLQNICKYTHDENEINFAESERSNKRTDITCKKGSKCSNLPDCKFLHLKKDYDEFKQTEVNLCKDSWACSYIIEGDCKFKHTDEQTDFANEERSKKKYKTICKNGKYCKPISCDFLHLKSDYEIDINEIEDKNVASEKKACSHGWMCFFLLSNKTCGFFHSEEEKAFAKNERNSKKTEQVCRHKEQKLCPFLAQDLCKNLHFKSDYEQIKMQTIKCNICQDLVLEFYSLSSCIHKLCLSCFENIQNKKCPFCRIVFDQPVKKNVSELQFFRIFFKMANDQVVGAVVEKNEYVSCFLTILKDKKLEIIASRVKFIYLGKQLENSSKLSSLKIEGGSVILVNISENRPLFPISQHNKIQVFLQTLENAGTIAIDLAQDDKMSDLFQLIQDKTGVPKKEQRLIIGGKQYDPNNILTCNLTISKIGIQKHSTIHLLLRLRGGGSIVLKY